MVEGNVDGVDVIFDGQDTGRASGGGTPRGRKKALGNLNACLKKGVDSVLFGTVRGDKCQFCVQFLGVFSNPCTVKLNVRPLFFQMSAVPPTSMYDVRRQWSRPWSLIVQFEIGDAVACFLVWAEMRM